MSGIMLNEEQFHEKFDPQKAESGGLLEFDDVANLPTRAVWTIVESGEEDENWYALPGFHIVNRLGYVTSEVPWTDDIVEAVYFDASDFEKDE